MKQMLIKYQSRFDNLELRMEKLKDNFRVFGCSYLNRIDVQENDNDKEAETEIIAIKKHIRNLKDTNTDVFKQV